MKPSVGRIVHLRDQSGGSHGETICKAAIITRINEDGTVDLRVFGQNDLWLPQVSESKDQEFLKWHWPERVE